VVRHLASCRCRRWWLPGNHHERAGPGHPGHQRRRILRDPDGPLLKRPAASFVERGLAIPVSTMYWLAEGGAALDVAVGWRLGGTVVVDPTADPSGRASSTATRPDTGSATATRRSPSR